MRWPFSISSAGNAGARSMNEGLARLLAAEPRSGTNAAIQLLDGMRVSMPWVGHASGPLFPWTKEMRVPPPVYTTKMPSRNRMGTTIDFALDIIHLLALD